MTLSETSNCAVVEQVQRSSLRSLTPPSHCSSVTESGGLVTRCNRYTNTVLLSITVDKAATSKMILMSYLSSIVLPSISSKCVTPFPLRHPAEQLMRRPRGVQIGSAVYDTVLQNNSHTSSFFCLCWFLYAPLLSFNTSSNSFSSLLAPCLSPHRVRVCFVWEYCMCVHILSLPTCVSVLSDYLCQILKKVRPAVVVVLLSWKQAEWFLGLCLTRSLSCPAWKGHKILKFPALLLGWAILIMWITRVICSRMVLVGNRQLAM